MIWRLRVALFGYHTNPNMINWRDKTQSLELIQDGARLRERFQDFLV